MVLIIYASSGITAALFMYPPPPQKNLSLVFIWKCKEVAKEKEGWTKVTTDEWLCVSL